MADPNCCCELQVGVIGVPIILAFTDCDDEIVDVSGATTKQVMLKGPNDITAATFTATYPTGETGVEGRIQYTTAVVGDIDHAGRWQAQGKVVVGTKTWLSKPVYFQVNANL